MGRPTEEEFVNEGLSAEEIEAFSKEEQLAPEPEDEGGSNDAQLDPGQPAIAKPDAQQDEQKTVDVRALQEARAEARAAREEAARVRDERIRLEERLNILNQAIAAQQKQPEQVKTGPTKDEDFIGWSEHKIETLEQQLARVNETEQQRAQAQQAEQQHNVLISRASNTLDSAIAANPQVSEALNHAFEGLREEIKAELVKHNVPQHLQAQEAERLWRSSMATMAQRLPADPAQAAEFVFRNARYYGWGYQPQQQAPQTQQNRPNPQELAARQERHMSLSNIQGGEAPQALTLDAVAKMSEKEFNKLCAKLGDEGMDRLMGAA